MVSPAGLKSTLDILPSSASEDAPVAASLPLPDLPPGPLDDLMRELHDLHALAGWPGTRQMAPATVDFSHTTVHTLFTNPRRPAPSWPILRAWLPASSV